MVSHKTHETSLFNMYRDKFDIELKNPEMPLFMCDDGELTKYPAETISLEIIKGTVPRKTLFAGEGHRSECTFCLFTAKCRQSTHNVSERGCELLCPASTAESHPFWERD